MIDLYCERVLPGPWDEPLNALTNLVFLAAAWAAWRLGRERSVLDAATRSLIALTAAIGVGSLLFHLFATPWAMAADVVPILLFQVAYLWVHLQRIVGAPIAARLAAVAALLLGIVFAGRLGHLCNGSLAYAPAWLLLLGLGTLHRRHARAQPALLLVAAGLLAMSLVFRSIDLAVCDGFPLGTHFAWHLLNGGVLYLVLRGLLSNLPRRHRSH